ncbi:hypothetical protein SAMN02745215_00917 [Desulfitobacterium chlororespirans DSM 11544]|uniref:Uncharacterized protein n=1 Tax=Desulfitobacterium chlororespirans DSM 11544 TaxID=1121395 RepID=A0A1M7SIS3_9FIRM|nr:hypothetical protein SAMN02745215_00917 [Desulfitobacterium chlororespirans DSM 11544]
MTPCSQEDEQGGFVIRRGYENDTKITKKDAVGKGGSEAICEVPYNAEHLKLRSNTIRKEGQIRAEPRPNAGCSMICQVGTLIALNSGVQVNTLNRVKAFPLVNKGDPDVRGGVH